MIRDLFSGRSSVLRGIGSIIDFSGSLHEYNPSRGAEKADALAIHNDFSAVGQDIAASINVWQSQNNKTKY